MLERRRQDLHQRLPFGAIFPPLVPGAIVIGAAEQDEVVRDVELARFGERGIQVARVVGAGPLSDGYVEQEFQFSGTAGLYAYTSGPPASWDISLQHVQPYSSHMIVRRRRCGATRWRRDPVEQNADARAHSAGRYQCIDCTRRFMLHEDAQRLMDGANASTIGKLGATVAP